MSLNEDNGTESAAYWIPIDELAPWDKNPRDNEHAIEPVAQSIKRFGFASPIIARAADKTIIAGHTRLLAAQRLGLDKVPVRFMDLDPSDARLLALADNKVGEIADWDDDMLGEVLRELDAEGVLTDMVDIGFDQDEIDALLKDVEILDEEEEETPTVKLAERFGLVPFSILDSRRGWWKNRKASWMSLGIRSEVGRANNLLGYSTTLRSASGKVPTYYKQLEAVKKRLGREISLQEFEDKYLEIPEGEGLSISGTSVFDPVLCELSYRWFSPSGGTVLDPFAGGSVRGVVAGKLGRKYVGVELRKEQVDANRVQGNAILGQQNIRKPVVCLASLRDALHWTPTKGCIQDATFSALSQIFKEHDIDTTFYNISWSSKRPKRDVAAIDAADVVIIFSSKEFLYRGVSDEKPANVINPLFASQQNERIKQALPHLHNKHIVIFSCDAKDTPEVLKRTLENVTPKTWTFISEQDFPLTIQSLRYNQLRTAGDAFGGNRELDFAYWGTTKRSLPNGEPSNDARFGVLKDLFYDEEFSVYLAGNGFGKRKPDSKWNPDLQSLAPELCKARATACFQWPGHGDKLTARYHEAVAFGLIPFVHVDYDTDNQFNVLDWQRFKTADELKEKLRLIKDEAVYQQRFRDVISAYKAVRPVDEDQIKRFADFILPVVPKPKVVKAEVLQCFHDPHTISPVQQVGDIWIKREDLFECNGARGSKPRTALVIAQKAKERGVGVIVAGSRNSPMCSRVARVAQKVGVPTRLHCAGSKKLSVEEQDAVRFGGTLVKHDDVGYLKVIRKRAEQDAKDRDWELVQFGFECDLHLEEIRRQVVNIPEGVQRIVVTVGSGMVISGILHGLDDVGRDIPVVGVLVGADAVERMDRVAPKNWRDRVELIKAELDFGQCAPQTRWWGIELDAHYESKAAPYVQPGDLFWNIAIRATAKTEVQEDRERRGTLPPLPKPKEDAAKDWQKGQTMFTLQAIAQVFKHHDEGLVLGAFTGFKERDAASALDAGHLVTIEEEGRPVAVCVYKRLSSGSKVKDFSQRVFASTKKGDIVISRFACFPGRHKELASLIRSVISDGDVVFVEAWQEKDTDVKLMHELGLHYVCSKIRASSEIRSVWCSTASRIVASYDDDGQQAEPLNLTQLEIDTIDVEPLVAKLDELQLSFADHYSNYNVKNTWTALALRGYSDDPSFIIKPSEMSKQWKADNAESLDWEIRDTPLRAQLPEVEAILDMLPGRKHRVRLMKLNAKKGQLTRHADITDRDAGTTNGALCRIHVPLITNEQVIFDSWGHDGKHRQCHMARGDVWYLDTRKPHQAKNGGDSDRVHLVIDLESSAELRLLFTENAPVATALLEKPEPEPEVPGLETTDVIMPTWIHGDSRDIVELTERVSADMIFSCPPYADLEVYSDDPQDISTLDYDEFKPAYEHIIAESCKLLKDDAFAAFVIGEARDKHGNYYNFVGDTIAAFRKAGLEYYNELIFVTPAGSWPIRLRRMFEAGRKVGKIHQNLLIFVKGDWRKAVENLGPVEQWSDGEISEFADPFSSDIE